MALDLGQPPLEYDTGIAGNKLILDSTGECAAEHVMDMAPGLRRQPTGLAVSPAAFGQCVVERLDMRGRDLHERKVAERGSEEVVDDLGIALMGFRRNSLSHRGKPCGEPIPENHTVRVNVISGVERA